MRLKKFVSAAAAAAMVSALLAVLSPTAAHAASSYKLKNAGGRYVTVSGTYLVMGSSTNLTFTDCCGEGNYLTLWNTSSNKNLGLSGNSTASGTRAVLAAGSSSNTQDWQWDPATLTTFQLKNRANPNMCLGISGGQTGTNVAIFACATGQIPNNQLWLRA
ncbi:RICIN domain-containing protein [Actinoplanes sp. NPDC048796]|uniref:RICIN domain-containing protein n=1 Tax=unclassified Actinoplanes TaxID=2626549 RepID=UPI0033C5E15D